MRQEKLHLRPLLQQTIVITGATSGIGLATAFLASKKGANVALASRNQEDLQKVVDKIKSKGGSAIGVVTDVTQLGDIENLRDRTLQAYGRIDTWINNAATTMYGPLINLSLEEERKLFDINFWGVRHGCRVAIPVLSRFGGTIINIGSDLSDHSAPLQGTYSASKHAVKAYTDALRMELEKMDIPVAVTLIRPASVDTPFTQHAANRMLTGAPSLPTPVYHPNVVARAILACAQKPRRDVYIGTSSRTTALLNSLFPRRLDLRLEKTSFASQSQGSKIPHEEEQEGLLHPPRTEGRLRGGHRGHVARMSLYTTIRLHPWMSLAAAGVLTMGIRQLLQYRRQKKGDRTSITLSQKLPARGVSAEI